MLIDLILASDTKIDATLANKGRDVGSWEEDKGDWEVLDKCNVEAVLTTELDIGSLKKVQGSSIKTALWRCVSLRAGGMVCGGPLTLWDGEQEASFETETNKVSFA